jgi:hypothetical protein
MVMSMRQAIRPSTVAKRLLGVGHQTSGSFTSVLCGSRTWDDLQLVGQQVGKHGASANAALHTRAGDNSAFSFPTLHTETTGLHEATESANKHVP